MAGAMPLLPLYAFMTYTGQGLSFLPLVRDLHVESEEYKLKYQYGRSVG
jgi:hypothetical protein